MKSSKPDTPYFLISRFWLRQAILVLRAFWNIDPICKDNFSPLLARGDWDESDDLYSRHVERCDKSDSARILNNGNNSLNDRQALYTSSLRVWSCRLQLGKLMRPLWGLSPSARLRESCETTTNVEPLRGGLEVLMQDVI